MPRYTVLSPLTHDGKYFAAGASVEMSEAQAAPLLGAVIEPAAEDITPLLDRTIREIVNAITERDAQGAPTISDEDLAALLDAEVNGKTRKTLVEAIAAEQADRAEAAKK